MKNIDYLVESMLGKKAAFDRREFLAQTGRSLIATSVIGEMIGDGNVFAQNKQASGDKDIHAGADTTPVALKPLNADTEKEEGDIFTPLHPGKRIGYAIVGLGHLALNQILPAFGSSQYAKPVALVSGSRAKAEKIAHQYGIPAKNIYDYNNYDSIKNNKEIDVVYIALPNGMHEEYTVRAAKAGKHVLCEKPMANTSREAQRMMAACKNANRKLMIAYRIQYEPNNSQIKKWARANEYGAVKVIESVNIQNIGDPAQWRLNKKLSGGGALRDIGLYCLNTSRYLLGTEPEAVFATTYSTAGDARFKEVEEAMMFQLFFPGGKLVNCTTSYGAHQSRRYRCYTDKGAWYGMDPAFDYKGLKMELSQAKGTVEWEQRPVTDEKNQFALEMDHFSECIMKDTKPYTPGEEGMQDMRIMEALEQSAREGKIVHLEKIKGTDIFRGAI